MQIQIESSRSGQPREWRVVVEQRVRFALRRLQREVRLARVSLCDINGHKGDIDKQCQITLQTDGHGTLVIVSQAAQAQQALNAALQRATHSLARLWQRKRRPARRGETAETLGLWPAG